MIKDRKKRKYYRDLPNEVKTSDKIKETKEIEILKEQLRLLQAKADLEYEKKWENDEYG